MFICDQCISLEGEGPRASSFLKDDEKTHQASHNASLRPVHELMMTANQDISQMQTSLDSHNFENPIFDVIKALEHAKTQSQGELNSHLQAITDYEEDAHDKVKKAFSEIRKQYQSVHD